jgi:hypothetical protein
VPNSILTAGKVFRIGQDNEKHQGISGPNTLDQTLVLRTLGYLSNAIMGQVEACLKVVMEIP